MAPMIPVQETESLALVCPGTVAILGTTLVGAQTMVGARSEPLLQHSLEWPYPSVPVVATHHGGSPL